MLFQSETLQYIRDHVRRLPDSIESVTPVNFVERHRYLPESVTALAGYIDFAVTPYWREVLNCFDINSPVREIKRNEGGTNRVDYVTRKRDFVLRGARQDAAHDAAIG